MTLRSILCFLTLFLLFPQVLYGWSDLVLEVLQGNQIKVGHKGRVETVRLYGIICPEPGQTSGRKARRYTSSVALGKRAKIRPVTRDSQGNTLALVWVNGHLLNQVLIREGYARVDRDSCGKSICDDWIRYEAWARDRGRGLWGGSGPVPR